MRIPFSVILLFCFSIGIIGQNIPRDRLVQWERVGLEHPVMNEGLLIDMKDQGADPSGQIPADDIVEEVFSMLDTGSAVLYFPAGTYSFNQPIELSTGISLRGDGADSTTLRLNMNNAWNGIRAVGEREQTSRALSRNGSKGDSVLQFASDSLTWEQGDYLYLWDEDGDEVTSSWAKYSTGQIVRIDSSGGDYVFLDEGLRRTFSVAGNARANRIIPIKNVSIEELKIERVDQMDQQTGNIQFRYAVNCEVRCIESNRCHFAHIDLSYSSNIEISGSYFHNAHRFGEGGRGYGVVVQYGTGNALITDNIFDSLRHAMLLQAGSNGNVLSYNYSRRPFWTSFPNDAAGDLVLHGNYPYANLMEGNVVQNIVIDASHGINGPYNTFFRNRAELYGIVMSPSVPTDSQNIVGNEITGQGVLFGNYVLAGEEHFTYGNNQNGNIRPPGTNELELSSLYLDSIPSWYSEHAFWPPIGLPNPINTYTNRAEWRFFEGLLTVCSDHDPTAIEEYDRSDHQFEVFPNPANRHINIKIREFIDNQPLWMTISGMDGRNWYRGSFRSSVSVSGWPQGVYVIVIRWKDGRVYRHKLMVY